MLDYPHNRSRGRPRQLITQPAADADGMDWGGLRAVEALSWLLTFCKRGTYYKLGLNSLWMSDIKHWLDQLIDNTQAHRHAHRQN